MCDVAGATRVPLRNRVSDSGAAVALADLDDVLGRRTLLALNDVEFHLLAFLERLEAAALDGAVMDKAVLLTIATADEAEALGVVEPLHCSLSTHVLLLFVLCSMECRFAVPSVHN